MFFGSGNTVGGGDGTCTIYSPEPRQYIPGIINGIYSQLGGRDDLTPYKAMYILSLYLHCTYNYIQTLYGPGIISGKNKLYCQVGDFMLPTYFMSQS